MINNLSQQVFEKDRMLNICAVVLTYNRLNLLKECMEALLKQSYPVERIIVIDNHSDDGTKEYVSDLSKDNEKIVYKRLKQNYGASRGFNIGIKEAYKVDCDFMWIMDDDTVPQNNALENLLEANDKLNDINVGFICSNVRWVDGTQCTMNVPGVSKENGLWMQDIENDCIRVDGCSFVSVLIPKVVVKDVGYPISEFYIWSTDVEYTYRITHGAKKNGYFAYKSIVVHKMKHNEGCNIEKDDPERIDRYKYMYRNRLYIARKLGFKALCRYFLDYFEDIRNILRSHDNLKFKKLKIMITGLWKGFFFNPQVEMTE